MIAWWELALVCVAALAVGFGLGLLYAEDSEQSHQGGGR